MLRTGFSRVISRLSIIFRLKSLVSLVTVKKFSKDESSYNISGLWLFVANLHNFPSGMSSA